MIELNGKLNNAKVFTNNVEETAIGQIIGMLNHEVTKDTQVRIMPDVHAGKGCTVGTTIKLPENFEDWKVCPNIVGVDVGCGITMYKLNNVNSISLSELDNKIKELIPSGFNIHYKQNDEIAKEILSKLTIDLGSKTSTHIINSLGTLGGGNHFIELGIDNDDNYWLSVHSGSRNLGVQVAKAHQKIAKETIKAKKLNLNEIIQKLKDEGKHKEIEQTIIEIKEKFNSTAINQPDLAYLKGSLLKDYLNDMTLAQEFAQANRYKILNTIVEAMNFEVADEFNSVHNFIEHCNFSNGIIRKGATSAKLGERLVIPLNMRDGSLICVGKGNEDWNESAPHGAGRLMSRSKAKENIDMNVFFEQMSDVYSSTVSESTLDEAPDAYKPAQEIIASIKPTVDIVHQVRPVYNFKSC